MNEMEDDLMMMFSEPVINIERESHKEESDQQPILKSLSKKSLKPLYQSSSQIFKVSSSHIEEYDKFMEQEFDSTMKEMNQESFSDLFFAG